MTDLSDLEAKARAATAGPWEGPAIGKLTEHVVYREDAIYGVVAYAQTDSDAVFIAAANPATALALIAVARAAKDANETESYGSFYGGDPRDFDPDPEASTAEERERHRVACAAAERGDDGARDLDADVCKLMGGKGEQPFGLGGQTLVLDGPLAAALAALEAL